MSLGGGSDPMGRGRQRAKQRKVARDLKYFSPETDYAALERELSSNNGMGNESSDDYGDDEYSAYEELAAKYDIPDEDYSDYEEFAAHSADSSAFSSHDYDDDGSWAARTESA
mgnify:CR=1 FL=1